MSEENSFSTFHLQYWQEDRVRRSFVMPRWNVQARKLLIPVEIGRQVYEWFWRLLKF